MRPYGDLDFPNRARAAMPAARLAEIAWLVVDGVLISPYPLRPCGLTAAEAAAITVMRKRLANARIGVWIAADGALRAQALESGPLEARRRAHACVRLRPDVAA